MFRPRRGAYAQRLDDTDFVEFRNAYIRELSTDNRQLEQERPLPKASR
ncbi:MAG TPA: hypothetical protein GXX57_01455 [Firmicutes bacterium]|nr:hypothetical protein [Bacillota bacterium]